MAPGIYDEGFKFDMNFGKMKKPVLFVLGAIFLIIVLCILMALPKQLEARPLQLRLDKSTISSGETTNLYATITNNSKNDARNVLLEVEAVDSKSIGVSYLGPEIYKGGKVTLSIVEKGGSRNPAFVINPVGSITPGTYIIKARLSMDDNVYEEEIALTVK